MKPCPSCSRPQENNAVRCNTCSWGSLANPTLQAQAPSPPTRLASIRNFLASSNKLIHVLMLSAIGAGWYLGGPLWALVVLVIALVVVSFVSGHI